MACQDWSTISLASFLKNPRNTEEANARIQSLRLQIIEINEEIRCLEEYKNTQLSVSRLPPEILLIVFDNLRFARHRNTSYSRLLPATQVCRLWRRVALESPNLWGNISVSMPKRIIELLLDRSGSAPLYVESMDSLAEDVMGSIILNHLSQLKELNLRYCKREWSTRFTSEKAPRLTCLSLGSLTPHIEFDARADAFPSLQHLSLEDCIYSSNLASLTTLRTLSIRYQHVTNESKLTNAADFLTILKSLPRLNNLDLCHALAPLDGLAPLPSVTLPSLTNLLIADRDIHNVAMMASITAPQMKVAKITHTGRAKAEIAASVVAAIYAKLPTLTTSYAELTLIAGRYTEASVKLWRDCTVEESANLTPMFQLCASGTGDLGAEHSVLTLCPSTTYPPLLHFQSDVSERDAGRLPIPLQRILSQLTAVTEIRTPGLLDLSHALGPATRQTVLLPRLKKVVTGRITCYKDQQGLLSKLQQQLKARKTSGEGIETWQVDNTLKLLATSDLSQFEGIVNVVKRRRR
ncbi:hypothetical protein AB1N83_001896 [Pleurotus pulmonarius]